MNQVAAKKRNLWWYMRFLLACYGAGFGVCVLVGMLALPFVGFDLFSWLLDGNSFPALATGMLCSPLIWRYLR